MSPKDQKSDILIAAMAQTALTQLDPELTDFCSCLQITPAVTEFYDVDQSDTELCLSNQSSNIEEESKLKRFTQALRMAQITAALKTQTKKKRIYSKTSKQTLKRCKQNCVKLESKSFYPLKEYMRYKGIAEKCDNTDTPTVELDNIFNAVQKKSEEMSPTGCSVFTCQSKASCPLVVQWWDKGVA